MNIEGLAGSLSDTMTADWQGAGESSPAPDPEILENLRIIERVAQAHQKLMNVGGENGPLPFPSWGHLRLLEPVGQGAYGRVFRAWDSHLDVEVALKLFHVDATSVSFLEREELMKEARTLAKLKHENIVRVHGADIHEGRVGFWMEFILGEPLSEEIAQRGAKDVYEAAILGIRVSKALAAAHAAGVLHRDIKPSNVVRETGGHLYLMDFGAGTLLKESRQIEGQRIGTPLYMAPEVLLHGESSVQSDIYSLGALLFHALTLRHPYEGETIPDLVAHHQRGHRLQLEEIRSDLPKTMRKVIDRCLEPDPRLRYSGATDLADELAEVLVPLVPTRPGRTKAGRTPATRLPLVLSVAGAVLLLAILAPWRQLRELVPGASPDRHIESVAVLSFESQGLESEEATYLSLGLGSLISARLSDLERIRVLPWVSSKRYRSGDIAVREAAALLGVEGLVLGSLVTHGDKMSGSVSLVDGTTEKQLWSHAIECDQDDILEAQREIVEGLGRAISGELTSPERLALAKPAARSVAAYELYLKGVVALQQSTEAGDDRAYELFRRALEIDPQLASALVGEGAIHLNRYFFGRRGGRSNLDRAEELFRGALELDPADTYAVQGLCHTLFEKNQGKDAVDLALGHAVGRPRDPEAIVVLAHTSALAGFTTIACDLLDMAVKREPADIAASWVRVFALAFDGQDERVLVAAEDHFLRFGESAEVHTWVGLSYLRLGQNSDALIHLNRAVLMSGKPIYAPLLLAAAIRASGDSTGAARFAADELRQIEASLAAYPDSERLQFCALYLNALLSDRHGLERITPTGPNLEYRQLFLGIDPCAAIQRIPTGTWAWFYFQPPLYPSTLATDVELRECVEQGREELRESERNYIHTHASQFAALGLSLSS